MFLYLKNKLVIKEKLIKDFPDPYDESILTSACSSGNLEIVNIILESVYQKEPKIDCSCSFFTAASKGYANICSFLIQKNVNISFDKYFMFDLDISTLNIGIISLLYDLSIKEVNEDFILRFLDKFIQNKNYDVVEFLLEKNAPHDDALFKAVKKSDYKMVSLILKYDSSFSFINRISEDGTVLNIAVKSNQYDITKHLLSINGIDPSLYGKDYCTPLMSAFQNFNLEIINLLFDFYVEDIQTQTFQFNESLKIILKSLVDKEETITENSIKTDSKPKFIFSFGRPKPAPLSKPTHNITDNEISVIKKLLEIKNIDINYQYNNYNLLSYSCKKNLIDIVSMLTKLNNCNLNQYSPIDGNSPLILAVIFKRIEIVNLLLKSPKININQSNYNQDTALTFAVLNELPDIVDLIINDPRFNANESRLNYSFAIANNSISQKLIACKKFDVNIFCKSSKIQKTILINAIHEKNDEKVQMILQHPTFDPIKSLINEAIFECSRHGTVKIFKLLLPFINNDINFNISNDSLLTVSSKNNNVDIVYEIINNPNFDPIKSMIVNAFNNMFIYGFNLNATICNMLLKADKDHLIDLQKLLPNGKSYFTYSNMIGIDSIIYLLKHGANPDLPDKFGIYPLQHAFECFKSRSIFVLIDSNKIDFNRKLKKYHIFSHNNTTYLHYAAKKSKSFILKTLLDFDVIDINSTDDEGETPLMCAVYYDRIDNVKLLFEKKGLDFLHRNNSGDDALSIAINKVSCECFQDTPKSKEDYLRILLFYMSQAMKNKVKKSPNLFKI